MIELIKFNERLDRTLFIDGTMRYANIDTALNIEHGQTIPKPTTVILMTAMLDLNKQCKVLEIGTGSGYHAAFLAEFASELYTVEYIPELSAKARQRLDSLGYNNVHYKVGDGGDGWQENAPYDRIIVTAAAGGMPASLLYQLNEKGRMVYPQLNAHGGQDLWLYDIDGAKHDVCRIEGVQFVPMQGRYGWKRE